MADKPSSQVRSEGGYNTSSNVGVRSSSTGGSSSSGTSNTISNLRAGTAAAVAKSLGKK